MEAETSNHASNRNGLDNTEAARRRWKPRQPTVACRTDGDRDVPRLLGAAGKPRLSDFRLGRFRSRVPRPLDAEGSRDSLPST